MDFDHGAAQPEVVRRLLPFIGAQAPDAPAAEHERVGRWVIENLINVGSLDRGFAVDYGTHRRRRPLRAAALRLQAARRAGGPGRRGVPARVRRGDQRAGRRARHGRRVRAGRGRGEAREPHQPRPARRRPAGRRAGPLPHRPVRRGAAAEARRHPPRRALGRLARRRARAARRGAHATSRAATARRRRSWTTSPPPATRRPSRRGAGRPRSWSASSRDCIQRHTQLQTRLQEAGAVFRAEQDRQQFAGQAAPRRDRRVRPAPAALPRPARRHGGWSRRRRSSARARGCGCRACPASAGSSRRCWRRRRTATPSASRCPCPSWRPPRRIRSAPTGGVGSTPRCPRRAAPCGSPRSSPRPGPPTPTCRGSWRCGCCTRSARPSRPPAPRATRSCCWPSTTARCCETPSTAERTCSSAPAEVL